MTLRIKKKFYFLKQILTFDFYHLTIINIYKSITEKYFFLPVFLGPVFSCHSIILLESKIVEWQEKTGPKNAGKSLDGPADGYHVFLQLARQWFQLEKSLCNVGIFKFIIYFFWVFYIIQYKFFTWNIIVMALTNKYKNDLIQCNINVPYRFVIHQGF